MGVLIGIIFFAILIFISMKMAEVKNRAKAHLLKNTGISNSDIQANFSKELEKPRLEKFLQEHPEYTEETIKNIFKNYCTQLFNRNKISEFSSTVCEKMQKDTKLDKLANMEFRRTIISGYNKNFILVDVVYCDGRDEYNVSLSAMIEENKIILDKYTIYKGVEVGF